jgi:hypothetical protein
MRRMTVRGLAVAVAAAIAMAMAPAVLAHETDWPSERRGLASDNTWAIQYLLRFHLQQLRWTGRSAPRPRRGCVTSSGSRVSSPTGS